MHSPKPFTTLGHESCGMFMRRLRENIKKIEVKKMGKTIQQNIYFQQPGQYICDYLSMCDMETCRFYPRMVLFPFSLYHWLGIQLMYKYYLFCRQYISFTSIYLLYTPCSVWCFTKILIRKLPYILIIQGLKQLRQVVNIILMFLTIS